MLKRVKIGNQWKWKDTNTGQIENSKDAFGTNPQSSFPVDSGFSKKRTAQQKARFTDRSQKLDAWKEEMKNKGYETDATLEAYNKSGKSVGTFDKWYSKNRNQDLKLKGPEVEKSGSGLSNIPRSEGLVNNKDYGKPGWYKDVEGGGKIRTGKPLTGNVVSPKMNTLYSEGYRMGQVKGVAQEGGRTTLPTINQDPRLVREAQIEGRNQIVKGNNNAYNAAQTPRTAGKWSGNIHSPARNSVLASQMRIQEQFQGQGANMGYRQAEQAARQQAEAAQVGAQNVAQGQQGGGTTGTVPGTQQKTPGVQQPTGMANIPPTQGGMTHKDFEIKQRQEQGGYIPGGMHKDSDGSAVKAQAGGGAKGGAGAMATAQTALKIAQALMPKKKQEVSWSKPGSGPGSAGLDWYDPNWY